MLELLVDTAEQYHRELECDRELYQVIALDAKGVPQSRITANRAARLLAEASQIATETPSTTKSNQRSNQTSAKAATSAEADTAQRAVPLQH
jgi:negative regulator of replication initiation